MAAILSPCGLYRYTLDRVPTQLMTHAQRRGIEMPVTTGRLLFVMLNPSTADANADDPTILRCMSFALAWGYDHLVVGNLFALRTPYPADLWEHQRNGLDIVGPENDEYLNRLAARADRVVIAWGNDGIGERAEHVLRLLRRRHDVYALGFTNSGQPKHPLARGRHRVPNNVELVRVLP